MCLRKLRRAHFHSVASGDPFDTSVLLWTRAVPLTNGTSPGPDQSVPVCVSYKVFRSPSLSGRPVNSGEAFTSYDVDFTVKVEATGLKADMKYWYFFADCTNPSSVSPTGVTRTISHPNTPAHLVNGGKNLTLAVFSCSQYQRGYFNAYGVGAHNTSADIFVHLGDYIYESLGNGAAGCSFSPSGACFTDRKLAAVRAYHEWMPVRQVAADDKLRIWRNFQIGKLLDLTMLDTRQYDRDLTDSFSQHYRNDIPQTGVDVNTIAAYPNRSLMGLDQENWFFNSLSESKYRGAVWRVVGQQIVFTQLNKSGRFDLDAWDGYRANRQRVLDHLYQSKIDNTIILSGDSHANWVSDLAHPNDTSYDPVTGHGAIGVEFAGTAVTSGSAFGTNIQPAAADAMSGVLVKANDELQWSEGSYRGFFTLTINSDTLTATYYAMNNINSANLDGFVSAQFVVHNGQ
ncbi:hypothetical protein EWM64_g767 [Hericium alpestre]|uniref:PhoD-like phosphatase metallophosphatase domain-containing protein n=1 Tax=Hericium alpestre TaxID=135208 RepID=A0A4Z0AAF4_9AGAM|nr:hypothetical protein EWM64_g767 [Hericium alpestre]